jgi:hypothetical protein
MKKHFSAIFMLGICLLACTTLFASEGKKDPAPDKTCVYMFSSPGYATLSGSPVRKRITCHGNEGTCWGIGSEGGRLFIDIYDYYNHVMSFWISGVPQQEPSDPDGSTNWSVDVINNPE